MTVNTLKALQGTPLRLQPHHSTKAPQPRFGFMGAEALSMLITDTTSVLIPKLLVTRTKINAFEDIFLECAENVPFYIVVPLVAKQFFARLFGNLNLSPAERSALADPLLKNKSVLETEQTILGTSLKNLSRRAEKAGIALPAKLVAAKAATILGALTLAGAVEYMIQHAKNVISAKKYNATEFTAVAGLSRNPNESNEDPVEKARRRGIQTGLVSMGLLGTALALPSLILKSGTAKNVAQRLLKQFDFGHNGTFDMSKPLLLILALVGFGSYLDASRDKLEFKENLTRVPIIIGFYMAGKELLSNTLGFFFQNQKVTVDGVQKKVKDVAPLLDRKLLFRDSFIDFNMVKSGGKLGEELSAIRGLPVQVRDFIIRKHQGISVGARLFTILIMGVLFNKLLYQATESRHAQNNPVQPAPRPSVNTGAAFSYMQKMRSPNPA